MSSGFALRSRAAIVAVAVTGSIVCGSLMSASASISSGDRSVFVPITPCRVMDTRPAPLTVGARTSPLGAGEVHTIAVLGSNGACSIPLDASAVAMNVTGVNPTVASFLTVFPADASRPLASSLNWVAGQGATPNAVTSDVSADGRVSFYNNSGSVDVLADIVGYFVDHNHDDRYYTEAEVDTKLATKADKSSGTLERILIGPAAFAVGGSTAISYSIDATGSIKSVSAPLCFQAPVSLPNGATVTLVWLDALDDNGSANVTVALNADALGSPGATEMAATSTAGFTGVAAIADVSIDVPVIDNSTRAYSVRLCMTTSQSFYDVRIDYTNP